MLNLRVEDIKEDHVTLVYTKNNRVRKVPITQSLKEALLARAHSSGFVFGRNTDGMPSRVEIVSVQFCRLAKRLGLAGVSHHTLRHTAATAMLESGVPLRAVQEIGGLTSLRMLERYAHPSDAEKRRAVELMAARTAPGTKTGTEPSRADSPKNHGSSKSLKGKGIGWRPQRDRTACKHRLIDGFQRDRRTKRRDSSIEPVLPGSGSCSPSRELWPTSRRCWCSTRRLRVSRRYRPLPDDAARRGSRPALRQPLCLLHQVAVGLGHFQPALALLPAGSPVAVRVDTREQRLRQRVQLAHHP